MEDDTKIRLYPVLKSILFKIYFITLLVCVLSVKVNPTLTHHL